MKIKNEIQKLKECDIYSLMLFALYKIKDVPEYSTLSEMCYILDKKNLLKLCEYFGGLTIKIPTIDELKSLVYTLVLYEYTHMENMTFEDAVKIVGAQCDSVKQLKENYAKLVEILKNYNFG